MNQPTENQESEKRKIDRRQLIQMALASGVLMTASPVLAESNERPPTVEELEAEIGPGLDEARAQAEAATAHMEEGPEKSYKEMQIMLNVFGAANFAYGIGSLISEEPISKTNYGVLAGLTAAKYAVSNEHDRHHILEEEKIGATAVTGITFMVALADSLQGDFMERYRAENPREELDSNEFNEEKERAQLEEDMALITCLASCLSPSITTLGSTGTMQKEIHEFVDRSVLFTEKKIRKENPNISEEDLAEKLNKKRSELTGVMIEHVANVSGILFLGDPPFIAVWLRFGFEALAWQALNCLPIALRAGGKSMGKYMSIIDDEPQNLAKQLKPFVRNAAMKETFMFALKEGLTTCGQVLLGTPAKVLASSTYAGYGDRLHNEIQNAEASGRGGYVDLKSFVEDKKEGFKDLALGRDLFGEHDHAKGAAHFGEASKQDVSVEELERLLEEVATKMEDRDSLKSVCHKVHQHIEKRDWEAARRSLATIRRDHPLGSELIAGRIKMLEEKDDNRYEIESSDIPLEVLQDPAKLKRYIAIQAVKHSGKNVFNFDRVHHALGASLADVLMALPFQVGHAVFLGPLLKDFLEGVGDLEQDIAQKTGADVSVVKDVVLYITIWAFSSIADNYLGADLGFANTDPDKALISLIAAIKGGKNTPIGNMANINLFSLDQNDFKSHMSTVIKTQIPDDVIDMTYAILWPRLWKAFGLEKVVTPY